MRTYLTQAIGFSVASAIVGSSSESRLFGFEQDTMLCWGLACICLALATTTTAAAKCANPIVRREWNELTASDKQTYVNAIVTLTKRNMNSGFYNASTISYHEFTATHAANAHWTHGTDLFYTYQRAMVAYFEQALQTVGWNRGLVYWDWASVSQNWWTSDVFQYFGAVSSTDPDNCVLDGPFAKGKFSVSTDAASLALRKVTGDQTCLRRCGMKGTPVTDATVINTILYATNYTSFRGDDTSNYHAVGHGTIGGNGCDLRNPSYSPNDPIFWLHHGFVDKVWWRWQQQCLEYKVDYEGILAKGDPMGKIVSPDQTLDSWTWWKARDMLDTEGDVLCYTYSKSASDLPISAPANCPQMPIQTTSAAPSSSTPPTPSSNISMTLLSSSTATSPPSLTSRMTSENVVAPSPKASAPAPVLYPDDKFLQLNLLFLISNAKPVAAWEIHPPTVQRRDASVQFDGPSTATHQNKFTVIQPSDGSIAVTYSNGQTIHIPPGYTLYRIFSTNVQAVCNQTGKARVFDSQRASVPYRKPACAPKDEVLPGAHACHLAKPMRLSREDADMYGMAFEAVQSNDNLVAMSIDSFNCRCLQEEGNYSPSQLKHVQERIR
ncbi:hypothetical protein BC830DRAFT_1129969 [Chytriomyces sp. MP71]|nr:hypothetical protein BC830DRAFT_1129969 [Chytriomyces sp. MP71]